MTDADPGAAVVVLARAPRPGDCKQGLEPLLGPDGCARLQAALIRRALAWAAEVGTPYLAYAPGDARDDLAALVPDGVRLVAQADGDRGARLTAAVEEVAAEHGGPVVLAGVDTPQMRPSVGHRALEDLRAGCDATFGPATDGGYYLVALREPHPEVFDLPAEAWGGPDVFPKTLEAAHRAGLTLGMLRAERDLQDEEDVRALLVDPLAPPEIVAILQKSE